MLGNTTFGGSNSSKGRRIKDPPYETDFLDESRAVSWLQGLLSGDAVEALHSYVHYQDGIITSSNDVIEWLKATYVDPLANVKAQKEFHNLKMYTGQDILQFSQDFSRLAAKAKISKDTWKGQFRDRVLTNIQPLITLQVIDPAVSFYQLTRLAQHLDESLKPGRQARRVQNQQQLGPPRRMGLITNALRTAFNTPTTSRAVVPFVQQNTAPMTPSPAPRTPALFRTAAPRDKTRDKCNDCGQFRHWKGEDACPIKGRIQELTLEEEEAAYG
ncbi:hypothetical protein EJ08DRAFT_703788 [Tothia fuscella]|uniref:Retrotransposon gag domain-containing protein n=1 Tax=Tothia fuscella TaxID=1048955 RepID=A0A9P4TRV2_9PEZI|nr:hypothetical protein EJ08DRAFT_703788 [Tothia fuscella]